ncbi:MAG: hypothetical protein FJY11_09770 [Bacteroidetes bacterium]|nr:hypothetical protein [Bacteroidota bacterium]
MQKYYEGTESDGEFQDLILLLDDAGLPERYGIVRDTILSAIAETQDEEPDVAHAAMIERQFISNITILNRQRYRVLYQYIAGVAASVAILVSSWFLYQTVRSPADTFDDPRIAYIETVKALNAISGNISKGTDILLKMEPGLRMDKGIRSLDAAGKILGRGIDLIPAINASVEGDEVKR